LFLAKLIDNIFVVVKLNDIFWDVDEQYTILQFLHTLGVLVPRFCYHEQLAIAGNCRVCLIDDVKSMKPVIAVVLI